MEKPILTVGSLLDEARRFTEQESLHPEPTIFGVTDGKAIGTYLEHKFQSHLESRYVHAGTDLGSVSAFDRLVSSARGSCSRRVRRPFISLSCSREDDRLASSARGSCFRRVDETVCLSVLFSRRR